MDPRDLNQAIRREHYQMPTIEEVATRLRNAKTFTVVDAKEIVGVDCHTVFALPRKSTHHARVR